MSEPGSIPGPESSVETPEPTARFTSRACRCVAGEDAEAIQASAPSPPTAIDPTVTNDSGPGTPRIAGAVRSWDPSVSLRAITSLAPVSTPQRSRA